jgi:hypothetical protein
MTIYIQMFLFLFFAKPALANTHPSDGNTLSREAHFHPLIKKHFVIKFDTSGRVIELKSKKLLTTQGSLRSYVLFLLKQLRDYRSIYKEQKGRHFQRDLAKHLGVEENVYPSDFDFQAPESFDSRSLRRPVGRLTHSASFRTLENQTEMGILNGEAHSLSQNYWLEKIEESLDALDEKSLDEWQKLAASKDPNKDKGFIAAWDEQFYQHFLGPLEGPVLANLNRPHFYLYRRLPAIATSLGQSIVRQFFPLNPALRTLHFVVERFVHQLTAIRTREQYMLLHWIESLPGHGGFEEREVALIRSSIYEAHIQWFSFWEYWRARRQWLHYGTRQFQKREASYSAKIKRYYGSKNTERLNFAFFRLPDQRIYNASTPPWLLSKRPSLAFDPEHPKGVRHYRSMMELASVGFNLLPLPSSLLYVGNQILLSTYMPQQNTEGAMHAFIAERLFDGDSKEEWPEHFIQYGIDAIDQ